MTDDLVVGWQKRRRVRTGEYKLRLNPFARAARNTASIAQQLRVLRGDLSRADFAACCGVDEAMVVHVETRKTRPSTAYLEAVALWLGRPVQEAFVLDPEPLREAEELLARHSTPAAGRPLEAPEVEADPDLVAALDRCIGSVAVTLLAPPHPRGWHLVVIPGREPETAPSLDVALRIVGPRPQPWEDLLRGVLASLYPPPPSSVTACWRAVVQAAPAASDSEPASTRRFSGRGRTAGLALACGIAAMM